MTEKVKQCKNCIYRLARTKDNPKILVGNTRVYKCTLRNTHKALSDSCENWSNINQKNVQLTLNLKGGD